MKVLDGLKYGLYIIFHPLDGFWCMKHEKKGNVASAIIILLSLVLVSILSYQYTSYVVEPIVIKELNVFYYFYSILGGFFLWCIANWCVTSLVDGEGSIKDIIMASAYALIPYILVNIPMIIISNFVTGDEVQIYSLIFTIALVWSGLLFFFGIMTIHQFTVTKTIFTILIAILGMVIIVFLGILFFALIQQMINFVLQIFTELSIR
jgi:hypothetical protein